MAIEPAGTAPAPPPATSDARSGATATTAGTSEPPPDAAVAEAAVDEEVEAEADAEVVEEEDAEEIVDDDEDEDEDDDEAPVAVARPASRPSPGRPPSAKEEPEPPFEIGERIRLIQNTRPRTGTPIGDHPVGSEGRIETVLSQTAIVRFDRAPDLKEVVAFVCLESLDPDAQARRAQREKEKAREAAEKEKADAAARS